LREYIINDVLQKCLKAGVTCQTIPRVREIIEGKVDIKRVREVKIEDLLGRPVRKPDVKGILTLIKGKTVLVAGAAGSIGSELCHQIASYKPAKIIMYDWWENGLFELGLELKRFFPKIPRVLVIGNIQDQTRVETTFNTYKPSLVFHAAAYKHVPLMEDHPIEAIKNNVFGTEILARTAKKAKVEKFIFISTDKAVNPKSIMGISKLIGEFIVNSMNSKTGTKFISVRFGNVLGSFGSILPIFKKQIAQGKPITITDKRMERFFMTIPEAAQLILKATTIGHGGEIFILDMGKPVKIVDLARKFILLSGLLPGKEIKLKFIGQRPGEKLKEELIAKDEEVSQTKFEEILIVKRQNIDQEKLKKLLKSLKIYCRQANEAKIIKELKSFVKSA